MISCSDQTENNFFFYENLFQQKAHVKARYRFRQEKLQSHCGTNQFKKLKSQKIKSHL